MLGIDTNVLVRFLVRDDEAQFERARKLIKRETSRGEPVFISQLVPLETECLIDKLRTEKPQSVIDAGVMLRTLMRDAHGGADSIFESVRLPCSQRDQDLSHGRRFHSA